MSSLIEQLNELKRQQAILSCRIKEEEERKRKLDNKSSIERLEALIEPITQHLDKREKNIYRPDELVPSLREQLIVSLKKKEETRIIKNLGKPSHRQNHFTNIKYNHNHMLANEEIFVTLLGIIKKQDVRITELENIINGKQSMNNFNQELPVNQIRNHSYDNHELELPCNR